MKTLKTVTVRIDANHAAQLLAGRTVAIKVPDGADILEIVAEPLPASAAPIFHGLAKLADVFFNGRKA